VLQFIQRFFGKPPSSATAKERLRLVLLSDHLSLAPDVVEALKHDLIEVISRYVEVDVPNCDVSFEHRDKEVAMLANIPILGMHARSVPPPLAPPPMPPPGDPIPQLELGSGPIGLVAVLDREAVAVTSPGGEPVGVSAAPEAKPTPKPSKAKPSATNVQRPTRRKRRKGMANGAAPAT
jgi:cell division topological specificity factor